jgi:hypothetical protein
MRSLWRPAGRRDARLLDPELATSRSVDIQATNHPEGLMDKDRWRRRDHKFAVGTVALMLFLMVAGFTSWMLNGNTTAAATSSSESGR